MSQSAEYQIFAAQALRTYVDSGKLDDLFEGDEEIAWVHIPKDGTGTVICRAEMQQFYIEFLALSSIYPI